MTRIKNWFRHNALLKLLSCVFGFLVWVLIANLSNPKVRASATVSLDVLNERTVTESSQVYSLSSKEISVQYVVRSKYRSNITPEAFNAYIDLEDYTQNSSVPVYLEVDSTITDFIEDISIAPEQIKVSTERIQQKKFAVTANVTGTVAEGYMLGKTELTPEYIYVKGPVSVMGQISGVCVDIDVTGAVSELSGTSTAYFTDANGNQLNGIEDNLSFAGDIGYQIPVYRIKTLTVNAFTGGAPASGFTVDSVETSPTFISVYGSEEVLNEYSYILIPGSALNISGITENKTFIIPTEDYLPEELKLATNTPEITVYVKIRSINEIKETQAPKESKPVNEAEGPGAIIIQETQAEEITSEVSEETASEDTSSISETTDSETEETLPYESENGGPGAVRTEQETIVETAPVPEQLPEESSIQNPEEPDTEAS